MKRIRLKRKRYWNGYLEKFTTTPFIAVGDGYAGTTFPTPKLCAASTARIFKLGRGATVVEAVFTKTKPRKGKYYKIICGRTGAIFTTAFGVSQGSYLKGYEGGLLSGVT